MIRLTTMARLTTAALLACVSAGERASAQPAPKSQPAPNLPAPQSPPQAPPQNNLPVSLEQALYLIRSTLLTLNDANRSGNYTVLRDLAAPGLQAKNTAADLAIIFSGLRRRNFDLFAAAVMAPQLTAAPALDDSRMLRLSGSFPTRPLQIKFDLLFENVGGQWRLFGIAVETPEAPPQAQASGSQPTAPRAAAGKGVPARPAQ
jgi:hypothetical protein